LGTAKLQLCVRSVVLLHGGQDAGVGVFAGNSLSPVEVNAGKLPAPARIGRTSVRYVTLPGFATKYETETPGLASSVDAMAWRCTTCAPPEWPRNIIDFILG